MKIQRVSLKEDAGKSYYTQSSKEIVKRAIEFKKPDRLPTYNDISLVNYKYYGPENLDNNGCDDWGCKWQTTEIKNMGYITRHSLLDWNLYKNYQFPDPDVKWRYENIKRDLLQGDQTKYVRCLIFMLLWERLQALRGMENAMMDLYIHRERIEELADRIVDYHISVARNIFRKGKGKIDGLFFTDDWGTQNNLMIPPQLWREFFKPRYKRFFDVVHNEGGHVWMHLCGKINEIIGDLIEIGLDVINFSQPRLLGIEEIGPRYRGKLCFETLCDGQVTLPLKREREIREEAQLLLIELSSADGGFILRDIDEVAGGFDIDTKQIMFDAFCKADPWKQK